MSTIYQVAYISKNTVDKNQSDVKNEIKDILNVARKNNKELGITGALLYSGGYFCQVLEGEKDKVEKLIKTIQSDNRHKEINILSGEFVTNRTFAEWDMAFAGIEEKMRFDIFGIKNSKDELAVKQSGQMLLQTLENLIKHQEILSGFRQSLSELKDQG